jgi:GEVED domain/SprB repeat/SdrD B-like domain
LGDIELHCAAPPLEIGNYVWWDHNLNGRMDPSEPGISNVNLTLYRDPNGNTAGNNPFDGDEVAVATTKTDAFGRYIFSFAGASNGLMAQTWIPAAPNNRVLPNIKYAVRINNFATDAGLTAFATGAGSPAFIMSPTQNQGVPGGQRDNNAYNNPGNATSAVTTGGTGDNDHNFDFAFGPASACNITAVPFGNTPCVGETLNLNANATGGTPPLTYSWAGPNSFTSTAAAPSIANVTVAATGTYTVTITNAACSASFTVLVQVNGFTVAATTTSTACGASTGTITLTPTGGFSPYSFDWANNALDGIQNPTGLAAGSYLVTVSDANGCTATTTATIGNTAGPTVTATPTNPTCGNSNGSVTLVVAGGTPMYTYDWSNNALDGIQNPTGLAAGTYSVTVSDNVGCITATQVTLTNTAGPSLASPVFVNTTCGLNNGSIDLTASGGLAPYTYDWNVNTLDGTEDPTGLAAGTYTVTVYDANNCPVSATVMIAPSTGFTASIAPTNETCSASNGAVSATAIGGTAPFSYDWNNIPGTDNGQMQSGLGAGTYAVTITDALGCTAVDSDMITNTPGPTLTLTPVNAQSCVANNGSINLQVTGSTGPYFYDWSNDNDPAPDRDSEDLMNLAAGSYTVTVEDANGCTVTGTTVVGLNTGAMVTPAVTDPTTCAQTGSITLGVSGGVSPYTYDWGHVPGTNNPANQTGLAAGVYVVTVTEANGCTTVASASVRDIREPALTTDLVQPTCGGTDGAIDLEVVGGDGVGPYSYNWSNLAPTSDPQDQMGLGAGNYTVTVTDELQCTTVLTVSLSNSAAPELTITPTNGSCGIPNAGVAVAITGGTPAYTINWDNLPGTNDPAMQTGLPAGTYAVTVTDGAGCIAVGNVSLTVTAAPTADCMATNATAGNNDGSIQVAVTEIGPFTFDWNVNALDGQQNPTGLAAGTYTVTVTDANNCAVVCSAAIIQVPSCTITAITFANQSTCNDNSTASNSTDDYFTANITVTFNGPPATGTLDLTGDVLAGGGAISVPVATAGSGPTYTFTGVRLRADGTASAVTATFSADVTCTFGVTNGPNVAFCSVPADYGDLPAPYPNNVSHVITPTLYLGSTPPDDEPASQPNGMATGDGADEDGLLIPPMVAGSPVTFTPTATNNTGNPAFLTIFFDSNGDGDFDDPGESMTVTVPTGTNNGSFPLVFNVPPNAPIGTDLGIRVRLSTQSGLTAIGAAPDGEVEDYLAQAACNNPNLTVINGQVCSGGSVDLATLVTNSGGGTLTYHTTVAAANAGTGALPSSTVTPAGATNYYVRSTLPNGCFAVQEVTVTIKAPVCGVITVTN